MIFTPLTGDDLGVLHNENYRVVQTEDGHTTFSYTKQGKGMNCHFACDHEALRRSKQVINGFCEWLFSQYAWCECIFAIVNKQSVDRLVKKCGFELIATDIKQQRIYTRLRT